MPPTAPAAERPVFLVVCADPSKLDFFDKILGKHLPDAKIFKASDYANGALKFRNVPPHVVVTDYELPPTKGPKLIEDVLGEKKGAAVPIVVSGPLPQREKYHDELVTGRIQFCEPGEEEEAVRCLFNALNFSGHAKPAEFYVRFVAKGQLLLEEGAKADCVYIVKRGQLSAFKRLPDGDKVVLGSIAVGEFVGEMAFVNGEPRTASVEALEDCELVEIPLGTLTKVLYRRPGWSQKLLETLARRLKQANDARVRQER
ncbi:MAG: Crp/Fnr family transcriptional regulator [Deltaproteobacteria bacterium]|nr:Crp/Fnr family transcriptional regulator [Deltaproteobacteria bacterium]